MKLDYALNRMRKLTIEGIPFSMEFISCNLSTNTSKGVVKVDKALLRTGYSKDSSLKSDILIGYTVEPEEKPRWFYLPLLIKFNGNNITP